MGGRFEVVCSSLRWYISVKDSWSGSASRLPNHSQYLTIWLTCRIAISSSSSKCLIIQGARGICVGLRSVLEESSVWSGDDSSSPRNMCKQGQFQTSLGHVELRMRQSIILGQAIKSNHNNDVDSCCWWCHFWQPLRCLWISFTYTGLSCSEQACAWCCCLESYYPFSPKHINPDSWAYSDIPFHCVLQVRVYALSPSGAVSCIPWRRASASRGNSCWWLTSSRKTLTCLSIPMSSLEGQEIWNRQGCKLQSKLVKH